VASCGPIVGLSRFVPVLKVILFLDPRTGMKPCGRKKPIARGRMVLVPIALQGSKHHERGLEARGTFSQASVWWINAATRIRKLNLAQ